MTAVVWLGVAGLTLAAVGGGLLGAAVADLESAQLLREAVA